MHLTYIDEVKYEDPRQPYYWLCALAIPGENVVSVEDSLNDIAEQYFGSVILDPTTEFHATKIVQGKGPFKGDKLAKRVQLFKDLVDAIDLHANIGRIKIRLDPSKMYSDDYQKLAFMFLVERVEMLMNRRLSKALLIADRDKEFVNTNVRNLSNYKAQGTSFELGHEIMNLVDTVHHTDSHHSRLIQLADIYTYSMCLLDKKHDKYPKSELTQYMRKLKNFRHPTKYKIWP